MLIRTIKLQPLVSPLVSRLRFPIPIKRYSFSSTANNVDKTIVLGAVSYCESITTIWEGMRSYFVNDAKVDFDFVLFTSYERQLKSLLRGHIDIAWNGPLAHARLQQMTNNTSVSLGMRDVDRDFQSVVVVRKDRSIKSLADLEQKRIATGTFDSPQAYIHPLHYLFKQQNLDPRTVDIVRFDRDIGKHGDTAVGEVDALKAVYAGDVDAALVSDMMWGRTVGEGRELGNEAGVIEVLENGGHVPVFDHCQFDCLETLCMSKQKSFMGTLFGMRMENEKAKKVMQLEGIKKEWMPPRETGYATMREAVSSWVPSQPDSLSSLSFRSEVVM